jgi:choline dehydrogenase-like flavoprotein
MTTLEEKNQLQHTVSPEEASRRPYDAVIVGSGVSGSIMAHELASQGYAVLVLEAGPGRDFSQNGYQHYLENFYSNPNKDNNAPFLPNPNAEMPRGPDTGKPDAYLLQKGPFISDTVYSRVLGGTTVHWEAKAIRMLREDFSTRTNFGVGLDWPIGLETLMPYYRRAEYELGVSGDVESQKKLGAEFEPDYVYPMVELKASYLDNIVAKGLDGLTVDVGGEQRPVDLSTFPQAKNADPNPSYAKWNEWDGNKPYKPRGAISFHQTNDGERCQGNTNCVPLCPVQARYDARKTLMAAMMLSKGRVDLLTQAVASCVHFDPETGAVTEIQVKIYESRESPQHRTVRFSGRLFILAANAVENARLMLASSELTGHPVNSLVGGHLMDHPYLLSWALLKKNAGVGRGPSCTSGISGFRQGKFREKMASFAGDIHNDGWGWATGSPNTDLVAAVDSNLFGRALRNKLIERISRQLLLAYMIELPADRDNRVTVDPQYKDKLDNMKPIISLKLPDYSMKTAEFVRDLSRKIFDKVRVEEDFTKYDPTQPGYVTYNGEGYSIRGGNHLSGTHVMGKDGTTSVVNEEQRSWDHRNLYMVGPGSMCSIGSSNTTLTTAALAFKAAADAIQQLKTLPQILARTT